MDKNDINIARGYCVHCWSFCPTKCIVKNGFFSQVMPDLDHPNAVDEICPKGLTGPELVYSTHRLKYPIRRTKPKKGFDPGWERISWEEAFDIIATKINDIKKKHGAETVAFNRCAPAGSQSWEYDSWVTRLAYAFGSPNNIATTHICQWARDNLTAYTTGTGILDPEIAKSSCILLWGQNPYNTWSALARDMDTAIAKGAKLIVVDPRKTILAKKADYWLQVRPNTDGALALGFLNVIILEKLYDKQFVTNWTTAPFLVRNDTLNLLKANEVIKNADPLCYIVWDQNTNGIKVYNPITVNYEDENVNPALFGGYCFTSFTGGKLECKTSFQMLKELVEKYTPTRVEEITKVPSNLIEQAARTFYTIKPASYYTWNGIEQQINSSQTNRAISLIYILTGNYDTCGSNRFLPRPKLNPVNGYEFITTEIERKRLGFQDYPLGPPGVIQPFKATHGAIRANDFYTAVLKGKPYQMKGLVAFGGNMVMANPDSLVAREALAKLDFYVHVDLFMNPSAQYADIILPAASFWETGNVRVGFRHSKEASCHVQIRTPVVSPIYESKSDMEIIFELAKRLGLGKIFWDGNIKEALNYHLAPTGITINELEKYPGGITLDLDSSEKGYSRINKKNGTPIGFATPSKKVEIYCQIFKDYGYEPLPVYKDPIKVFCASLEDYPLLLTCFKLREYNHSSGRCLPSLRKLVPHPYIEINPITAKQLGITKDQWVSIETQYGAMRAKTKLTASIHKDVVAVQHGWWQDCPELNLPDYNPYSSDGSNVQLLSTSKYCDPIIGSYHLKGIPCRVKKFNI